MAMRVKCPKCGAQYNLDPQKLSPQGTKVRCSSCQHIFVVKRKAGEGEASAPPKPVPAPARPKPDDDPVHGGAKAAPMSDSLMDDQPIPMNDETSDVSPASAPKYRETLHDLGKVPPPSASPAPVAPAPKPAAPAQTPPAPAPAAAKPPSPAAPRPQSSAVADSGAKWRVKKQGLGLIYGPADLNTVQSWIQNERINAKDAFSRDGSEWATPEMYTEVAPLLGLTPSPDAMAPGAASVPPKPAPAAAASEAATEPVKMAPPVPQEPRRPSTMGFELDSIEDVPPEAPKGGSLVLTGVIGLVLLVIALGGVFYFVILPDDDMIDRFYAGPARPFIEPIVASLRPDYRTFEDRETVRLHQMILRQQLQTQAEEAATRSYVEAYLPKEEGPASGPIQKALTVILADTDEAYTTALADLESVAAAEDAPPEAAAAVRMVKALAALSAGDSTQADVALTAIEGVDQLSRSPMGNRVAFISGLILAKRFTEAQKASSDEVGRNPGDPFLRYLAGLSKLSDPAGMDDYRKVLEVEAGFLAAKAEIASRLAVGATDLAQAETLVREILSAAPSHRKARMVAATLAIDVEAISGPQQAGTLAPLSDREVTDLFIRTEQLVKDQKLADATANLDQLLTQYRNQLTPQMRGAAHYYRGEMYRVGGDLAAANVQYETALIENPRETRARKALEKLEAGHVPRPEAPPPAPVPSQPAVAPAAPAAEPAPAPVPAAPVPEPADVPVKPAESARPPDVPPPPTDLPPLPPE